MEEPGELRLGAFVGDHALRLNLNIGARVQLACGCGINQFLVGNRIPQREREP